MPKNSDNPWLGNTPPIHKDTSQKDTSQKEAQEIPEIPTDKEVVNKINKTSTNQTEVQQDGMVRLAEAAEAYVKQERWSKRFTNALKIIIALYFVVSLVTLAGFMGSEAVKPEKHLAVIKLEGAIMAGSKNSAERFIPLLRKAFENEKAQAVILDVNSPGGSPVQSAMINDEIMRLKQLHNKKVYAVAQDICASGCYYIVAAADEIYANRGSLIGSIGVRFDSFGFTDLMDKIGVENRSMTAGEHKTFINPFGEEDPAAKKFFQERVLERTHQQFIEVVKAGRGVKLQDNPDLFSGLVWLGDEALELGLVDGLADIGKIARDLENLPTLRNYDHDKSIVEQMMGDLVSETALKISQHINGFVF